MFPAIAAMGTVVSIQVVGDAHDAGQDAMRREAVDRAFQCFRRVEACCSRFDPDSEAMQLTHRIGTAVPVSDVLFDTVAFALAVASASGGALDPTVGLTMERRGFNRHYRTRETVHTPLAPDAAVNYHDIHMDPERRTIALRRPLILDLGAVAKGMAIDMAARELRPFRDFAVYAGGDLYLGGRNPQGAPWSVGIRHPRTDGEIIDFVQVSDAAVCTSGDYERRSPSASGHHIVDPRTGAEARDCSSVTVIAPTALEADAFATAAFVMGPDEGLQWLERRGVDGLVVTTSLERLSTRGMDARRPALSPNA